MKRVVQYKERRKKFLNDKKSEENEELLVDYDDEIENNHVGIQGGVLNDLFDSSDSENEEIEDDDDISEEYITPKIIYCSRTHTQLDQFVQEFKKTRFSSEFSIVTLTSRQKMCINSRISKLPPNMINDACLDMKNNAAQDKKKKCTFYDPSSQKLFKDHLLVKSRDIEELISLGKELRGLC